MPQFKLITAPLQSPVSVDDLKNNLRILHNDQNDFLSKIIEQATSIVERETGRQLMPATWEYQSNVVPSTLRIFRAPFIAVTSCTYIDENDQTKTLTADNDDFYVDPAEPAVVTFAVQPTVKKIADGFKFRFTAGYASYHAIPNDLKLAILLVAGRIYENPTDPVSTLPTLSTRLISNYRVYAYQ